MKLKLLSVLMILIFFLSSCAPASAPNPNNFVLIADTGSRVYLDQLIPAFQKETGIRTEVIYAEPVKAKNLASEAIAGKYPASAFLAGDGSFLNSELKNPTKIAETNIVFGIDTSTAQKIGWNTGSSHSIIEVIDLMENGTIKPIICNANRCIAGALFFTAVINGLKGNPGDVLSMADVMDQSIMSQGKNFYQFVKPTDSAADSLKLYLDDKINNVNQFNAIVATEPDGAKANEQLVQNGKTPLTWFYLTDATMIATPILGCVDGPNLEKCTKLQQFLVNESSQKIISSTGWRAAIFGIPVNTAILKSDWGFSTTPSFAFIPAPKQDVMSKFISVFISNYKKPVDMVICGDDSGSMDSNGGKTQFNQAMKSIFDLNWASQYNIQPGPEDRTTVMLFGKDVKTIGTLTGNDPSEMANFANIVISSHTDNRDNTAIYECGYTALLHFTKNWRPDVNHVLVLMTDGLSNYGREREQFIEDYKKVNKANPGISIISISFGLDAEGELGNSRFGKYVNGTYFRGDDLIAAFEKIRGGN